MSKSIIFTLFENRYEYGVGALINSAFACNFSGKIIVGYKGALPFWISQLNKKNDKYYLSNFKDIEIEFIEIETELHLRYYKPFFFEQLFKIYINYKIYYFDPDITIIGDWDFFEEWIDYGMGLVLDDCYPIMPYNHPIKQQWAKLYDYDLENGSNFNYYINSGFIGCSINSLDLIIKWKNNILLLVQNGNDLTELKPAIKRTKTHKRLNSITGDQDILNATIIQNYNSIKVSIVGPEGMGFIPAGYLMHHNTGIKTWERKFILDFLKRGSKISPANYSFQENSFSPINLYPNKITQNLRKMEILITQILQRIF